MANQHNAVEWTPEAEAKLKEIPFFVRPAARKKIEKFGDGIMSAIDFTLDVEKEEDPKGDRVKVIMSGKFLPYKKW